MRSSPMKPRKGAPNLWDPENAAPKRSDGAEDVKDVDITGVDVDFEAGRRWLAEGELDEGRRARYLTPQRADAEAFDTPVRPTGARAKADPTNGVTDVRIQSGFEASMVAQMQELMASNARAFEAINSCICATIDASKPLCMRTSVTPFVGSAFARAPVGRTGVSKASASARCGVR